MLEWGKWGMVGGEREEWGVGVGWRGEGQKETGALGPKNQKVLSLF